MKARRDARHPKQPRVRRQVQRKQPDRGPEREPDEHDRLREFALQPAKRGAHVFDLADAAVVLAFAQPGAAEVEAQHGKAEAVERFHGVEDDLVVHGAAEERMRMTDERGVGGAGRAGVEHGLEAAGGAGQEQRANLRVGAQRERAGPPLRRAAGVRP